jgi:hypothetical protein
MCEGFPICVTVSFRRQDLYWDKLHFLEPVYLAVYEELELGRPRIFAQQLRSNENVEYYGMRT